MKVLSKSVPYCRSTANYSLVYFSSLDVHNIHLIPTKSMTIRRPGTQAMKGNISMTSLCFGIRIQKILRFRKYRYNHVCKIFRARTLFIVYV